ncbi:MAG: glycosyltransferase, partial [Chloroflexi bacterium]|nr:glycosyltransferase [Chloroflexota bacterium]
MPVAQVDGSSRPVARSTAAPICKPPSSSRAPASSPNTIIEGAACGCIPICTAVGCIPELVEDGHNGYIIERSAEGLIRGVKRALEHPNPLSLSVAAIETIYSGWSYEKRAPYFFAVFDALVENRTPRPFCWDVIEPERI